MKRIYLVDCRSVGTYKLRVDETNSLVYYFTYGDNYIKGLKGHEREIHSDCTKLYQLSFIINSRLGFYAHHFGKTCTYFIVSWRSEFDISIQYWGSLGYKVVSCPCAIDAINLDSVDYRKVINVFYNWYDSRNSTKASLFNVISRIRYSTKIDINLLVEQLYAEMG